MVTNMDDRVDGLKPILNVEDQTCFGCGAANSNGLQMTFHKDGHHVYSFLTVPASMGGWDRIVHGGILSTILDEIMGWTVIALLQKIGVTKTMMVDFLRPVSVGQQLKVVGSVIEMPSERIATISGVIFDDNDRECATATGTFSVMPSKVAVRLGVVSKEFMARFERVLNDDKIFMDK